MPSTMKTWFSLSTVLALSALVACGGGGGGSAAPATPTTASILGYTDPPPSASAYLLKKNTSLSSGSHLVLDLVGPASGAASGVSITLGADSTKTTWANVAPGDPVNLVENGTAFNLGSAPLILLARTSSGNALKATAAQKGPGNPVAVNAPLLRVALDLKPNLGLASGTAITLSADSTQCQILDGTGTLAPITVSVGTLTAQ